MPLMISEPFFLGTALKFCVILKGWTHKNHSRGKGALRRASRIPYEKSVRQLRATNWRFSREIVQLQFAVGDTKFMKAAETWPGGSRHVDDSSSIAES
jgi:hypothetical protein